MVENYFMNFQFKLKIVIKFLLLKNASYLNDEFLLCWCWASRSQLTKLILLYNILILTKHMKGDEPIYNIFSEFLKPIKTCNHYRTRHLCESDELNIFSNRV